MKLSSVDSGFLASWGNFTANGVDEFDAVDHIRTARKMKDFIYKSTYGSNAYSQEMAVSSARHCPRGRPKHICLDSKKINQHCSPSLVHLDVIVLMLTVCFLYNMLTQESIWSKVRLSALLSKEFSKL